MSLFPRRRERPRNCPGCGKTLSPSRERALPCAACMRTGKYRLASAADVMKAAKAVATGQMAVVNTPARPVCTHCGKDTAGSTGYCFTCLAESMCRITSSMTAMQGSLSLAGSALAGLTGSITDSGMQLKRPELPVVQRDDLLKGTKYATLWRNDRGEPEFGGTGYTTTRYSAEGKAICAKGCDHEVPDPYCTCGFWVAVHPKSKLARWDSQYVALEVEFGGKVVDCGKDPLPADPWGYRAQWQRALSVTLPAQCDAWRTTDLTGYYIHVAWPPYGTADYACGSAPKYLVGDTTGQVRTACEKHVVGCAFIPKPVSWLRQHLRTEIRPGTVTDDETLPATLAAPYQGRLRRRYWNIAVPPGASLQLQELPYPPGAINVEWHWDTDYGTGVTTYTCSWDEYS